MCHIPALVLHVKIKFHFKTSIVMKKIENNFAVIIVIVTGCLCDIYKKA